MCDRQPGEPCAGRAALKVRLDVAQAVTLLTPQSVCRLPGDIVTNIEACPRERLKDLPRSVLAGISLFKTKTGAVSACLDHEIPTSAGLRAGVP